MTSHCPIKANHYQPLLSSKIRVPRSLLRHDVAVKLQVQATTGGHQANLGALPRLP